MSDAKRPDQPLVLVSSTSFEPEIKDETMPIARAARPGPGRKVVMSLGPGEEGALPLPDDYEPGDQLEIYAEFEVTTDAPDMGNPGRFEQPYPRLAPLVQATLLIAKDPTASQHGERGAHSVVKSDVSKITHDRHHLVLSLEGRFEVPKDGPLSRAPLFINFALAAAHPEARPDGLNVLLLGENEPTRDVDKDLAGIRVVRFRPGSQPRSKPLARVAAKRRGVPLTKMSTPVFVHELSDLEPDEQLLVRSELVTEAARGGIVTRVSGKLYITDDPARDETSQMVRDSVSWAGNLSRQNGANAVPGAGPNRLKKYGVARIRRRPRGKLYVVLAATAAAPQGSSRTPGGEIAVGRESFMEVTRFAPGLRG